jgi:hypothetical protein
MTPALMAATTATAVIDFTQQLFIVILLAASRR